MNDGRTIVIGGGLAGMACAVALEQAGRPVTLLEARRHLGGRAGSFEDPQTGELLDNCQHVLLGCCTNLIDFYRRIGAIDQITFHRAIHFRDETGQRFDLAGTSGLSAPFHLGPALLRFGLLDWNERLALTAAMVEMMRLGRTGRQQLLGMPFGQWLDIQQQPESLVRKLYDPIVISGLNENTRDASAAYAIQIFQEALLENAGGYVFGMPNCTLTELYRSLPIRGLRLGTRVNGLRFEGGRVTGVELVGGEVLECSSVVLATNFHTISRWIPDPLRKTDRRFDHLDKLQSVPILGVHLWFDRPVMTESHCAFVRGPLQWVFRKDESGSAVHGVISAARNWLDRDRDQMAREFEVQVRAMLPMARNAKLQRSQVVIEKRATFSPSPGVDQYRPTQSPDEHGIPNLYLAGDYTKTGWPATMEGAVRSGYAAAGAIVGTQFIVRDLEKQWGARIMGE